MSTCPELTAHIEDAERALGSYKAKRAKGLDVLAGFDLMLLEDALEAALKQAVIETNALHALVCDEEPW